MKTEQKKYEVFKRNFIFLFLVLSLVPLFTVSLISYFSFKNSLHNTISTHLFEIAKNKGIALQKWLFERHTDAEVFAQSPTIVESVTAGTQECKKGKSGVGEYLDYRGKNVLGSYFFIPEMEWSLMVEQDSSEAFQEIQHLKNIIFVIGLITIIVIVAFTLLVYGKIVKILKKYDQQFKKQQKQIMRAEKLATVGQLAASLAHEINNPLGGISNCLKLISTKINKSNPKPKDFKDSIKYLRTSEQELNRCIRIVRNFLSFSKRPNLNPILSNINTVILELIALIEPQATVQNIMISKELKSDLPQVKVDTQQLHQALMNIILNSLEAMPQGGKLKVRSRYDQRDEAIKIEITDTGYGIPEENLPYLFEPFFSSKPEGKGIGLGLSIVYEVIDEHNGSIEVESEVDKGTTFIIKLPLHKEI